MNAASPPWAAMDAVRARRSLLATRRNPGPGAPYLVSLSETIPWHRAAGSGASKANVEIVFVPGRSVLEPGAFNRYCARLGETAPEIPEELGVTVRDDLVSEVMPQWLRVVVTIERADAGGGRHRVVLEDAEPGWTGEDLELPPHPATHRSAG